MTYTLPLNMVLCRGRPGVTGSVRRLGILEVGGRGGVFGRD